MSAQDDVHDEGGRRLDQIRLTGLSATGYHGVFAHERREGQTFVADVVVHLDTRRAAAGDDLAHTVDYGELAQLVTAVLAGEPVDLVETVAERIAATVLARPHVQAVDVAVHKPQAPITVPFGDVVVAIRRDRTKLPAAEPYRPPTGQVRRGDGRHPVTAEQPGARSAPPLAEPPAPVPEPAQPVPAATAQPAPPAPARVSVSDALAGGVPTTDAGRHAHDAGPDGAGAVLVGPAPTGAVPTGVMPAVPSGPAAELWSAPHEEAPYSYDGPPTELMAPVVDVERAEPTPPAPDPARTELMAPVTDVVEGELVLDAFDEPPAHPVRAVLALGANLGPAQDTLRQAVADLAATPGLEVVAVSPLARTAAVGPEQPDYLNAVVLTRTTLAPRELLRAVQAVELRHGRERREHWGPRTLDIDVVVHGETLGVTDDLELPHPRAHQRAFVLQPWAQVDPEAVLPGLGGGPVSLLAATAPDRDGVRWMALDWLTAPVPAANAEPDGAGEAHHP